MPDCKYMDGITCNFEHETAHEDCMLCMPNAMLVHVGILMNAICSVRVEFGFAKNIYAAFGEMKEIQKGLFKLMKEAYPEAVERAKVPREPPRRMDVA